MRVSKAILAVLVLSLSAAPASALLQYSNIDWPGEGPIETGSRLRVDDNGNVGISMTTSARIWDVGASTYTDYGRPASDREVMLVHGKTTSGDVAIAYEEGQGAWFWDASASTWVEHMSGRPNFFDQNDTHAVMFRYDNKDNWVVDLATNTATFLTNEMKANDPRISVNGTISGKVGDTSLGKVTPDGGTTVRLTGMSTKDVNDSGNAAGSIAYPGAEEQGLQPYFYDYAADSLTAMPFFGDLDPANNNEYHVEGINNSDEVVGYVRRGGETYRGFYWKKGDSALTDLATLVDLPGYINPNEMFQHQYAQVCDINNDGWIVGVAKTNSGRESFLLTPEPATLFVLLGGVLAGFARRRR